MARQRMGNGLIAMLSAAIIGACIGGLKGALIGFMVVVCLLSIALKLDALMKED